MSTGRTPAESNLPARPMDGSPTRNALRNKLNARNTSNLILTAKAVTAVFVNKMQRGKGLFVSA